MTFDSENPVIKLCAQGMQTEASGNTQDAHQLFEQAWELAGNDFERFTVAHYLARNQPTHELNLHWNLEALRYAQLLPAEGAKGHYPSLYLNIGKSYENLSNTAEAINYYQLAFDSSSALPDGNYGNMLRSGITEALKRMGISPYTNAVLDELINTWCENKKLRPLAIVLPAYVGNMGTENDINKLTSALSYLAAVRCLGDEEQEKIETLIKNLSNNF